MATLNFIKENANNKKALMAFALMVVLLASPATEASAAEATENAAAEKPVAAHVAYVDAEPSYTVTLLATGDEPDEPAALDESFGVATEDEAAADVDDNFGVAADDDFGVSVDDDFAADATTDDATADTTDAGTSPEANSTSTTDPKSGATVTTDADGNKVTDYSKVLTDAQAHEGEATKTNDVQDSNEVKDALTNADNAEVLKYKDVFDAKYYLENNPDVRAACNNDALAALNHFLKYGANEGRKGNATFSVEGYYNANQDLRNAYGAALSKFYTHYAEHGKTEGRTASATTLTDYRTVYGNDYSAVYDGAYYRKNNADLETAFTKTVGTFKLFDDTALLKHFINYGMREGRASTANFEVESYYNANQDLRAAYGTNLAKYYTHYMNYGKKEGRTAKSVTKLQNYRTTTGGTDYAPVYDGAYYRTQNPDLDKAYTKTVSGHTLFDDTALLNHFVKYGMRETRQASANFDVFSYYNANSDLRAAYGTDLTKYYTHYIKNGKKEGRTATGTTNGITSWCTVYGGTDYAPVYDAQYYWNNNADLSKAFTKTINGHTITDDAGLIAHFVKYGAQEGRLPVPLDVFNVSSYYNEYKDLRHAYGFNLAKYYAHYAKVGKTEGRNTTGCTELKEYDTVYAGVNWSHVYDGAYYRTHNSDIEKYCTRKAGDFTLYDDQRQLAHFYNYGTAELRKGNSTFDAYSYFLEYEDVRMAYHESYRGCYEHYTRYGWKEGRHQNGCTKLHGVQPMRFATARQLKVVNAAKTTGAAPVGYCATWVYWVMEKAGLPVEGLNARDYYWKFCKSSDFSDLKIGMVVSIPSHTRTTSGMQYGHVSVYVGNGIIMDSVNGHVREVDLYEWVDYYSTTYKAAWGWYQGIALC